LQAEGEAYKEGQGLLENEKVRNNNSNESFKISFSSIDLPAPSPPAASPATEMKGGVWHLGGRICIAVGLDLSACMYRRRLLYRRLGLGFPLRFSGSGGGGGVSGEDRRRIVTVGSAALIQRQPSLLFLGLSVVVFSGDGDDICASGGTRYVFSSCDGEAAPW
jgi:hypothetical protein